MHEILSRKASLRGGSRPRSSTSSRPCFHSSHSKEGHKLNCATLIKSLVFPTALHLAAINGKAAAISDEARSGESLLEGGLHRHRTLQLKSGLLGA